MPPLQANQFRLLLHSAAYLLLHGLRHLALAATFGSIQKRLLKVAARFRECKTRIDISFPAAVPLKEIHIIMHQQLHQPPTSVNRPGWSGGQKRRLLALLDLGFPEHHEHFAAVTGVTSLAVLEAFPAAEELTQVDIRRLTRLLREASRGRCGRAQTQRRRAAAKSSFALTRAMSRWPWRQAAVFRAHDPLFEGVYNRPRQRDRGKRHLFALPHVANKMHHVVFSVLRNSRPYTPQVPAPAIA